MGEGSLTRFFAFYSEQILFYKNYCKRSGENRGSLRWICSQMRMSQLPGEVDG